MSLQLRGVIRNGRVEVDDPIDLPDGTGVVVAPETPLDDGPVPPAEIAHTLAAMHRLRPLDIPDAVAADLDAWERRVNRHGIDHAEDGLADVFR